MKNITNNAIVIGIIGLVVGLVLGWMIGRGNTVVPGTAMNKDAASDEVTVTTRTDSEMMVKNTANVLFSDVTMSQESDSAIMVADQMAGNMVTVGSVETDTSAWVAVREDVKGMPGRVLGAARVDAGESRNIVIKLLRETMPNMKYQINLYKDNGDRKFDTKTDMLMTSDGKLISQSFMTSAQ
jgi:hypothetical protein